MSGPLGYAHTGIAKPVQTVSWQVEQIFAVLALREKAGRFLIVNREFFKEFLADFVSLL